MSITEVPVKPLRRIKRKQLTIHPNITGIHPGIWGDFSNLSGDCSRLRGNCSDLDELMEFLQKENLLAGLHIERPAINPELSTSEQ